MLKRWASLTAVIALLIIFVIPHKSGSTLIATIPNPIIELAQTNNPKNSSPPQNVNKNTLPDEARLIDLHTVNNKIALDMRYATDNNFLKRKVYPAARCVLRGAAAQALSQVQNDLAKQGLGLKVYDCYRPLSVQRLMWEILPDSRYVANPTKGSRHNRGAAVDLTLIDRNGKELEMPTEFDDFTEKAFRNSKLASPQAQKNSLLLENAMKKYGFIPLATEWWHFDVAGWDKFSVLDIPFGAIPVK
jgi:D-alanyl-D-alanine dipeptidase